MNVIYKIPYPKSLHSKKQEGAEHREDDSSPHWDLEQYVECKCCAQHCSIGTIDQPSGMSSEHTQGGKLIV
jgi:hypothetical protein